MILPAILFCTVSDCSLKLSDNMQSKIYYSNCLSPLSGSYHSLPLHNLSSLLAKGCFWLLFSSQVVKMAQRLGIIIFGATGYTGKVVVEKIVSLAQKKNLSWGVAGRSKAKLQNVLNEVSKKQGLYFDI